MAPLYTPPRQKSAVHVASPCTMQAGFTFMAEHEGALIRVTVPQGGVQEGQTIAVPYPPEPRQMSEGTPFLTRESFISRKAWKSSLFDCGRYGYCHSHVWSALMCPQLLLAQILTRQKMNWLGERAPDHEWKSTFRIMLMLVIVYWTLSILLSPPSPIWMVDSQGRLIRLPNHEQVPALQIVAYNSLSWLFGIYTVVILMKVRRALRQTHQIPDPRNSASRDCCLSVCCGSCVVAQMARETCDYEHQPAACCSPSGLGKALPNGDSSAAPHPFLIV